MVLLRFHFQLFFRSKFFSESAARIPATILVHPGAADSRNSQTDSRTGSDQGRGRTRRGGRSDDGSGAGWELKYKAKVENLKYVGT